MALFQKKSKTITIVNNENLYFVQQNLSGCGCIPRSYSLDQFLAYSGDSETIYQAVKRGDNSLLILPDHWFGFTSYPFQSKKGSIIEAFIERKLKAEHPELPDIKNFFDYNFCKIEQEKQGLYIYFMQDPKAFQLYDKLAEFNLSPKRITTPALLWKEELKNLVPDFNRGGRLFVHLLPSESFLYFFFQGRFLFSRSIAILDTDNELSEKLSPLIYEINQSLYLFSQKTKAAIDQIYLLSPDNENSGLLSELLKKDVEDLNEMINRSDMPLDGTDYLGSVDVLIGKGLPSFSDILSISHKRVKRELRWQPVQSVGLAVGLILLLLLGSESFLLSRWYQPHGFRNATSRFYAQIKSKEILQKYNDTLDTLLRAAKHPSPQEKIMNIAKSLPENIWINDMTIVVENSPMADIKGFVKANDPEHFKSSLCDLIANLNSNLRLRQPMSLQNIDFSLEETIFEKGYQTYPIKMKFGLL